MPGDKFGGSPEKSVVCIFGNCNALEGCTWNHNTTNDPDRAVYTGGDNNRVAGTVLSSGYNVNTVRVAGGSDNIIRLSAYPDGAKVDSGVTDTRIYGDLNWSQVSDGGTRTVINDVGLNAGHPNSPGDWNGTATRV